MASILDMMSGITYPEKAIVFYADMAAVNRLGELEDEASNLTNEESDRNNEILAEQEDLKKQLWDGRWTFTLRGIPRVVLDSLNKKSVAVSNKNGLMQNEFISYELVLRSIVNIEDAKGEKLDFTEDQLREFLGAVPSDVFDRFVSVADQLAGNALKYEHKVTDPNF